ncbi:hypothetical protein AWW66_03540 [Micromonospora rosaria]|uniref:Integrase n=1 Tax=Micromonospora rosaria TaxID=47874 RepID=A0A136PY50_9ACTN|nr:site-specific integrase [Micromonospora rosaria]KXK63400.1 hypothetical protein AWW66_03540 [Micromonospora rosaria]
MWIEKNGPTYRIRDLVGGKKVTIRAGFPTKTAARKAMTQAEADALRGEALVPRGGRISLGDWLDKWWPSYAASLKPSSRISAEGIIRRYIRPTLGHLALEDIAPSTVQQWVALLLAGWDGQRALSVKTVYNAHGLLHKVMGAAVFDRLIRANPCERTGLPERVHHEMRFLTEPEAGRLLAAIPEHWRPMVATLLGTGLRWSEAAGLRVGAVDLLGGTLRVVETMQELADTAELVFVQPKSRLSRRTVPLPAYVIDALVPLVSGRARDALVFRAVQGGPVRYRVFHPTWARAVKEAGLDGLRIHDLRHTHAAWLISAGVPLTAIQRRLGHASIAVTSDRYGHLMPEVDEGILRTLNSALPQVEVGESGRGEVGESGSDQPGSNRISSDVPARRAG